jgi:hypothetical protein
MENKEEFELNYYTLMLMNYSSHNFKIKDSSDHTLDIFSSNKTKDIPEGYNVFCIGVYNNYNYNFYKNTVYSTNVLVNHAEKNLIDNNDLNIKFKYVISLLEPCKMCCILFQFSNLIIENLCYIKDDRNYILSKNLQDFKTKNINKIFKVDNSFFFSY